jgi:SAM-dependent methyltransferase
MIDKLSTSYDAFYKARNPEHVYPPEFVVRAFLGTYPRLPGPKPDFTGAKALDLGFGDGRTIPLLANLGMTVHGVEISEDICQRGKERMARLGIDVEVRVGRNHRIPHDDAYFDHVLACHACYYVDPGTTFADNVREIARVLKNGGWFVFSAPIGTSYILNGARDLGGGHMEIANDPYGLRNGYVLKKFDSPEEIRESLAPWFGDVHVGACRNDFWGIEEHVWIVVCTRGAAGP